VVIVWGDNPPPTEGAPRGKGESFVKGELFGKSHKGGDSLCSGHYIKKKTDGIKKKNGSSLGGKVYGCVGGQSPALGRNILKERQMAVRQTS